VKIAPGVLPDALRKTRRKGMSITENLILMVVLGITFGAIFTTLVWAQKTRVHSMLDRESRELLFSWVQAFESFFPPDGPDLGTVADAVAAGSRATGRLGGVTIADTADAHTGRIGHFALTATPTILPLPYYGRINLQIVITSGGRHTPWVDLVRRFNRFSSETVSDATMDPMDP
jgi:hypothetical protein